jgi:hypothetical protein
MFILDVVSGLLLMLVKFILADVGVEAEQTGFVLLSTCLCVRRYYEYQKSGDK